MVFIKNIIAIISFLINELPKFLKTYRKVKADKTYYTDSEVRKEALKEYHKTSSLEDLKKLEDSQ